MMRTAFSTIVLACLLSATAAAQSADHVIFLVRHAERADAGTQPMMNSDPPLSEAGQTRARRLAVVLGAAGIAHVFTTEFQRSKQTAAPLAANAHLTPVVIPSGDIDALVNRLRKAAGPALVVAHSNTIPDIVKKLGVTTQVSIEETEFDNLFIVVRRPSGAATLVRLKY